MAREDWTYVHIKNGRYRAIKEIADSEGRTAPQQLDKILEAAGVPEIPEKKALRVKA